MKQQQTFGNIALGLMLVQNIGIGLLPVMFGYNGLYLCSLGSLSYGLYAFCLPGRMIYRLKPRVPAGSPGELCIRDLFRAWGMFCIALGAMGLSICRHEEEGQEEDARGGGSSSTNAALQQYANTIFLVIGLVSVMWDWHLMRAKHWEAEAFLIVNISANTAICIAAGSGLLLGGGP
mmetsp:Transcript_17280/g.25843  ORF Transcript_17280/g.25843 Transcript_17280/m.25843 type:complete len:177 (-) Transcript_17280:238-768(-)